MDDVDDDAVLFHFRGWSAGTAKMVSKAASPTTIAGNVNYTIKVKMHDGALGYIPVLSAAVTS